MTPQPAAPAASPGSAARIANAAFLIILILTNLWFFTQAMSYVR